MMITNKEVSKVRKQDQELELSKEDRWMIWLKPPTLFELYKGLTKKHIRQVREAKYDCKKCGTSRGVTYKYQYFVKQVKGSPEIKSKHLGAFCQQCNWRCRFVRDTPARWQVMREINRAKRDAIRTKSGRNNDKKKKRDHRR